MTYYEQLVELLSEIPEIKKDIFFLKFGTNILYKNVKYKLINITRDFQEVYHCYNPETQKYISIPYNSLTKKYFVNLGNYINEGHLRMYCEKNDLFMWIHSNGDWYITKCLLLPSIIFKIDDKKDFHAQEEDIYKKIVDFLTHLIKKYE